MMGVGLALIWLAALSVYDVRQRRLPNWLTLPGAAVILLVATLLGHGVAAWGGALTLTALYLLVHIVSPRSLGGGDVKLAIGLGALTGAFGIDVWVVAALAAPLLTAVWALVAVLRDKSTVPHGPSMCVASAAAVALVLVQQ